MKIAVICGMSDEKVRARLSPIVEINNIEHIYLVRRTPLRMRKVICYHAPGCIRWSLFLSEIYRFVCLLWICLTKRPDVLYAIYFVPHGIYAAVTGFLFRKRVVQELIGTDRHKVMQSKIYLRILGSAKSVGVRGTHSFKQLVEIGFPEYKLFTPIAVNILDYQHFKPREIPKRYDFIYCGRMDENKQLHILIHALAKCQKTNQYMRAIFVGDGPTRVELETLTSRLDLASTIKFVGKQPYEVIPDYLNQARVFMMASAFEGLPVAMLEALSCGLPVIVPEIGDICDIAKHGKNAWVVKSAMVSEYVKGFERFLNDHEFYKSLVAGAIETRAMFISNFSLQKAQKIWEEVLSV